MIFENQGAHYGYKNKKNKVKAKHFFDKMYYPSSPVWRSKVSGDPYEMMNRMMENFEKLESG